MTHKYVIVHFVRGDPEQKEFKSSDWPLHVTLSGNFNTNETEVGLVNKLLSYSQTLSPITLKVGRKEMFGPNKNIEVNVLEMNEEILNLHLGLKDTLDSLESTFDTPQYVGSGYKAHSTVQGDDKLNDGEDITIKSFSLVDMEPNGDTGKRRFIKTFSF